MTTIFIDNEPQYWADGPPGVFVPLAEAEVLLAQLAALTAERDALLNLINEAYDKLGGGHHPYASGVRDALGYVLRGKDEARRALEGSEEL